MLTVQRDPGASESVYRRVTTRILRWLFPDLEGYDVVQEDAKQTSVPDYIVFKIRSRPGVTDYMYDFMVVETKKEGMLWSSAIDQMSLHCENTHNDSNELYGMVQIGLHVQFFSVG